MPNPLRPLTSGSSILEVIVLLAIVGFIFSVAVPSFSCFEKARVRGEVEKLAARVQYLQGLAVATGHIQELPVKNSTFPGNKITCYPSGVVCAGTVYVTDQSKRYLGLRPCYSLAIPVGGYYRYIREQDCKFCP